MSAQGAGRACSRAVSGSAILFIRLPRDILARVNPQRSNSLTRHLFLGRQSELTFGVMTLRGPVAGNDASAIRSRVRRARTEVCSQGEERPS
jgi:hypothetical protein